MKNPAPPVAEPAVSPNKPEGPHQGGGHLPTIPSSEILKGRDAINIEHNGRVYQLRRTKQGKLILTK